MRPKETMKKTVSSSVYNKLLRSQFSEPFDPPHRGCNDSWDERRTWKRYRRHQYRPLLVPSARTIDWGDWATD